MQKFDVTGPIAVVLNIPAGRVRLVAGERADAVVEVRPAEESKKRDVKAAEQTEVSFADGVLRIATADPSRIFGSSGSLEVRVELPVGSRVEGKAGAAELYSTGRLGEVAFEGGYKKVALDEVEDLALKVHTGEVSVGRLSGSGRISNGMGDVSVREAFGGAVEVSTGSGNLSVGAARGVSATLDASTSYGRIQNALNNSEGVGAPLNIKATTGHGDIAAMSL